MEEMSEQPCVTLHIDDPVLRQCYSLRVPGATQDEGWEFLRQMGSASVGSGARQFLAGATWAPIRQRYQAVDRELAQAAQASLSALGPRPGPDQLEALVRRASSQRTRAARVWRLPTGPDAFLVAEVRDWVKYGVGGRNFGNLMQRSMSQPARASWTREDHLLQVLRNVEKTHAGVDAAVMRNARYLKAGGAFLMVAGLGWTLMDYQRTPDHRKGEFLQREAATATGGAFASGLATAVLVAASASGVVIIGVGLVAGMAGALAAEGLYHSLHGQSLMGQLRDTGVLQAGLLQGKH